MIDKTMDIKRRLGLASGGGGQSYELIRSTQSLVERLNLNTEEICIQPVHPSIMGQDNWFSITYTRSNTTRYFSCQNARERDEWITSLRKTLAPSEDRRRTENSLKIWVFEVKGLSDKRKYFCEIHLDDKIYARTSSKKMLGMCFWGEYFSFAGLPKADKITILIFKDKGGKGVVRRQRKPVGRVKICVSSVQSRREVEKWYPVEKTNRREPPSIRLKCQFQSIDILPLREYEELLKFLKDDYRTLCKLLEPHISVKVKEELSYSLMSVFKMQDVAEDILADIVVHEISNNDNDSLTFRGNSIATKAMEAYVKMVSEKYLEDTLRSTLTDILNSDFDLEVDPIKVASPELLETHREDLRNVVSIVWRRIANSHSIFPVQLQRCFNKIRTYLEQVGKGDMANKLVSSCLFLRYLCPAILGPNLFKLTEEYPSSKSNRNLTLIAKTLQTLANFARYEGKENSMEFMNSFLDEEVENMAKFLEQVSSPPPIDWIHGLSPIGAERSDLGRHLSSLHTILVENVSKLPSHTTTINIGGTGADGPGTKTSSSSTSFSLDRLKTILNEINSSLHRPTTITLDNIAEPTPVKIKRMSAEETTHAHTLHRSPTASTLPTSPSTNANNSGSASSHQNSVISNWMSWTLGRGERKGKVSHPIPQHELRHRVPLATTTTYFYTPDVTESSSSSASLTPSPKYSANVSGSNLWNSTTKSGIRKGSWKSASSISIIDDSDSESSSGSSSQYRGTDYQHFSTLPRPSRAETKTLSDYEREISGLRTAMETLQVKLHDAERKLQLQQASGSTSSGSERSTTSPPRNSPPIKDPELYNSIYYDTDHLDAKDVVGRLLKEEDLLRRDQHNMVNKVGDKEMMILLQQRKIAALDEANNRLLSELARLSEKMNTPSGNGGGSMNYRNGKKMSPCGGGAVQDTPRTVDELLDSFNDTPV